MKILLVTPASGILGFFGDWSESAFKTLDCEIKRFDYRASRLGIIGKLRGYSGFINECVIRKMNSDLINEVTVFNPDIVLVFFGETVSIDTLREIKKREKLLVNWFHDSIVMEIRSKFLEEFPKYYDCFLIIDSEEALKKVKIDCKHVSLLSLACDESVHKKVELSAGEKERYESDLIFFGTVVPHRAIPLEEVADLGLSIWGPKQNIYGSWIEQYPKLAKCYKGGRLEKASDIVKLNNAAKVIVNTHGLSGKKLYSLPSRIFESAGCGAFQITEYSDILANHFKIGEEIVCFKNKDELREIVKYYLVHPDERQRIAKNGQARAYRDHTFKKRMQEFINLTENYVRNNK